VKRRLLHSARADPSHIRRLLSDGLATQLAMGASPDDEAVHALVDEHRAVIDRWFYPCSI